MVYAPQTQSGSFFNDQEREVSSLQWVEALSLSRDWRGQHVFKFGTDLQRSQLRRLQREPAGRDPASRRIARRADRVRRPRRSRTSAAPSSRCSRRIAGASDSRLTFELGLRLDRDAVVERVNWSPRAGVAIGVLPEGRGILRGGFGKFVQRTPLNVGAFPSVRVAHGHAVRGRRRAARPARDVRQRPRRRPAHARGATSATSNGTSASAAALLFKLAFLRRHGLARVHRCRRIRARGELRLSSTGTSRYRELEATTRYLGGERRDLTVSYVWAQGHGRSQQLRSVLRQPPQPDRPRQREQPDPHRRPASAAGARHDRAAGQVGLRAGARAPVGVPVVGGGLAHRVA